ncbi:MAG: hypothetical protein ISS77_08135 [Phycisphaerae bacterium]|nr:hypothetical protein [Phycisphaerae bacterium]
MPTILKSIFTGNQAGYETFYQSEDANDPNYYSEITIAGGNRDEDTFVIGPPRGDVLGTGGGIFTSSSPLQLCDSIFYNNIVNGSGGGAYLSGDINLAGLDCMTINNCLFTNNTAGIDGGGITCSSNTMLNIYSTTIADNSAEGLIGFNDMGNMDGYGGGLSVTYDSNALIQNSIVWGNKSSYVTGKELAVGGYDPNEFWNIKDESSLYVSYCDVWGGEQYAFVRPANPAVGSIGGQLFWQIDPFDSNESTNLHGTSLDDPLFTAPLIDNNNFDPNYYLSHAGLDPNQLVDSRCIDRGYGDADSLPLGRFPYTTRTDNKTDGNDIENNIDLGFHYYKVGKFTEGDLNYDAKIDGIDVQLLIENWLSMCYAPKWCFGSDLNKDGIVNFADLNMVTKYYGAGDVEPPIPDRMKWAVSPSASSETSISMVAANAVDNSGSPVEYYFQCTYCPASVGGGDCNSLDSGWISVTDYTVSGLALNTEYGFRVKARDTTQKEIEKYNETAYSFVGYAVTGDDTEAPKPDPTEWYLVPASAGPNSIVMTVKESTDNFGGPIQYYFERSSDIGDANSGWQTSTTWTDIVPDVNDANYPNDIVYSYMAKARDYKPDPNDSHETKWSIVKTAQPGTDEAAPVPNPSTWNIPPSADGSGAVFMAATEAVDSSLSEVQYNFWCLTDPNFNRDWTADRAYRAIGLDSGTEYQFRVQARDASDNRTEWSIVGAATPGADDTAPFPNPMQWQTPPIGSSDVSIIMIAQEAIDSAGSDVEYYFESVFGGGHDSGWDPCSIYEDTGLTEGQTYGYKVYARDSAGNVTEPSLVGLAIAEDMFAPVPDPMTWEIEPYPVSSTQFSMTATEAYDENPTGVEYYFECVTDPNFNSGWYDNRIYEPNTLDPNSEYSFRVKARDKSSNQNETNWSDPSGTTTFNPPDPYYPTWASEPYGIGTLGRNDFSFTMTAGTVTHTNGVEYYFECMEYSGTWPSGFSSSWQTDPTWSLSNIGPATMVLTFRFKAREVGNPQNETAWSYEARTD